MSFKQFSNLIPLWLTNGESAYLHVFIKSAVYVMQKPMCRVHFVATHEVTSRMGNMAAICIDCTICVRSVCACVFRVDAKRANGKGAIER